MLDKIVLTRTRETILEEMRNDPYITEKKLMEKTGIGKTAIYNNISWLKKNGCIRREGSRNGGRWTVTEPRPGVDRGVPEPGGNGMDALMPLTNMAFEPGHLREAIETLPDPDIRAIATGEYYYYSGQAEKCDAVVQDYLDSPQLALRLTANWFFAYANFILNRADISLKALGDIRKIVSESAAGGVQERLMATFVATGATVLLHLPDRDIPDIAPFVKELPEGLRLLAIYVIAHKTYLDGEYQRSMGMAESALMGCGRIYPLPMIYLHLVLVMDMVSLRMTEKAREHFRMAWELAKPDGLVEPFAEHHGLLQGLVELQLRKTDPEALQRIMNLVYRFSCGWRQIHNPHSEDQVADGLTTTEFIISMMACRGWKNREIAGELDISEATVKANLRAVFEKLGITKRSELKRFMLK